MRRRKSRDGGDVATAAIHAPSFNVESIALYWQLGFKQGCLKLIYQYRFLHGTLSVLAIPHGKMTVMHLVLRVWLSEPTRRMMRRKTMVVLLPLRRFTRHPTTRSHFKSNPFGKSQLNEEIHFETRLLLNASAKID